MAINSGSSIYGLLNPKGKGALSLQTIGSAPLGEQDDENTGLPTSPFANLPITPGVSGTPAQIQAVQAANIPANFQFTGEFDAANRGLLQQETDYGFSRTNTLAQLAEQYQQSIRQAEKQQMQGRKSLFASLADRGALGSGAALSSVADFDTEYNDYLNNLSRERASGVANAENSYASALNQLGRQREGLVSKQQAAEEARRLQEEQLKAEAARNAQLEEQRRGDIQRMIESQNAATAAAQAATAAAQRATYSNGFSGGGGGGGYGGGGGGQPQQQQYKPGEQRVTMPSGANGMGQSGWTNWVHNNLDANASPAAVQAVLQQLMKDQPRGGTPISDLAWLIQQYPNQPVSQSDVGGKVYGGRFF